MTRFKLFCCALSTHKSNRQVHSSVFKDMTLIARLTPNHVVVNNVLSANDPTALANSKKLSKLLTNAEVSYTAYCNQTNKPKKAEIDSHIQVRAIDSFLKPILSNPTHFSFLCDLLERVASKWFSSRTRTDFCFR